LKDLPKAPSTAAPTGGVQLSARDQALKAGGPKAGARERVLNQDLDLFDIIKGHLLDEGYADTEESATAIMANMSEEWRESIIEQSNTLITPEQRRADELKYGMKRTTPVSSPAAKTKPSSKISY
jgi:hypothetical protein